MAPRVARCCHRGARALLPPARHQAGLLGRPRAPRVPAEMGDRRGSRYAPFRLPFFSADARVRLLRISRWTRERGDARARSPRRRVSRRTRPPLPARWAPADLAVPPTPLPSLLLSAARPPPIANVVKELETLNYRWAYRVVDLPGAYLFEATRRVAIEPTRRSRARDGDARLEPPRPSARAPLAAGFPPFFKRFLRRSRIEGPDRVGEDALGAGTETRDGL